METIMRFVDPAEITQPSSQVSQNQLNMQPTRSHDSPQNPLSMEEFSDLTVLLSAAASNVDTACSTDEQLSTPVFDKEAFDYNSNGKVKFEFNETRSPFLCDSNSLVNQPKQQSNRNIHNNNNAISASGDDTDVFLYQPSEARLFPSLCKDSPNDHLLDHRYLDEEEEGLLRPFGTNLDSISNNIKRHHSPGKSPQEDDRYSYVSSPANDLLMAVPEHYDHSYTANPMRLNLMTEYFKFPLKEEAFSTLNTPDVIDDAMNLESDFNILNIINNGELSFMDANEELFQSLTTSPTNTTTTSTTLSSEPSTPSSVISPESSNQQQSESSRAPQRQSNRRRKRSYKQIIDDDDDDEDYVPPTATRRRVSTLEDSMSSNDSFLQPPKRGRPPKRAADSSLTINEEAGGGGESKYRELRDKNNEASRKSRQKRKIKEQEYEKEADDLYRANIRLKAQVEQLEETVAAFRNNLFKILVPK